MNPYTNHCKLQHDVDLPIQTLGGLYKTREQLKLTARHACVRPGLSGACRREDCVEGKDGVFPGNLKN